MRDLCIYLASASPRRLELLRQLGFDPGVLRHAVEEVPAPREAPGEYARRMAAAKGRDAAARLDPGAAPGIVLAADTVVTIEGSILGKPADASEAERMLRRLRGASHSVLTAIYLRRTDDGRDCATLESTHVVFRAYDDATLRAYLRTGEPLDKAGAYGIQGYGAFLSERIEGSWSNVVGLPLECLPGCLDAIGVEPSGLFQGRLTSR